MNSMEKADEKEPVVDLGFLEESVSWKLESRFFPSKVGGKPAWLDLLNLPSHILCAKCNKPCIFLSQIYAPIEEEGSCFHRMLFLFLCGDKQCCQQNYSGNFKVFRCQLSRKNKFYSFDPPIEEENWQSEVVPEMCKMCFVCGARGEKHCGRCKAVNYCSKEHQIFDWKASHKESCVAGTGSVQEAKKVQVRAGILLPEFEIVIETEDCSPHDELNEDFKTEEQKLHDFEKMIQEGKAGSLQGNCSVDEELQKISSTEDKQFSKFTSRIKQSPGQVLRYERGGEPLWISSNRIPNESDIPHCEYCGGQRQFEFQVLPQLLNYLNLDSTGQSIDWGTLAVYTCAKNCDGNPVYKQEFLWKQDISPA